MHVSLIFVFKNVSIKFQLLKRCLNYIFFNKIINTINGYWYLQWLTKLCIDIYVKI